MSGSEPNSLSAHSQNGELNGKANEKEVPSDVERGIKRPRSRLSSAIETFSPIW